LQSISNLVFLGLGITSNMQPSRTYIASNYKMEACATNVRMFIHPSQLAFRPHIHDDLGMAC